MIEVSKFDFKCCVILIYILKMSDRAGKELITFGFYTN